MFREPEHQERVLASIEGAMRLGVIGLGVLYVCGFSVVFLSLSHYGISFSISLLRAQYIIVGVLALGPLVLTGLFLGIYRDFSKQSPSPLAVESAVSWTWRKIKSGGRVAFYLLAALAFVDVFLNVFASPFLPASRPKSLLWSNLSSLATLGIFSLMLAKSFASTWRSIRLLSVEKEHRSSKQLSLAVWRVPFCCMISFVYLAYFSTAVYPRIPQSAGGGRPLEVVFLLKEQGNGFAALAADSSGTRSVPYKLLLETDRSYVVIPRDPREQAMEFSRDAVFGFVVLQER